jgi:GNAT superfamily N-acetyltransferase
MALIPASTMSAFPPRCAVRHSFHVDAPADEVFGTHNPIDAVRADEFPADPRHHLAVAVQGGRVVGFASAVHYVHPDKPRPELWINEVSVAATHRGRGLGTRLLRSLFAVARCLGCAEAWVLTDRANTAAMRLYAASGSTTAPTDHVMFTFRLDSGSASGAADAEPGTAANRPRD